MRPCHTPGIHEADDQAPHQQQRCVRNENPSQEKPRDDANRDGHQDKQHHAGAIAGGHPQYDHHGLHQCTLAIGRYCICVHMVLDMSTRGVFYVGESNSTSIYLLFRHGSYLTQILAVVQLAR